MNYLSIFFLYTIVGGRVTHIMHIMYVAIFAACPCILRTPLLILSQCVPVLMLGDKRCPSAEINQSMASLVKRPRFIMYLLIHGLSPTTWQSLKGALPRTAACRRSFACRIVAFSSGSLISFAHSCARFNKKAFTWACRSTMLWLLKLLLPKLPRRRRLGLDWPV